ncbi:DUF4013 domain-containing protein [archaeon]|jgi:hypothetical protein|nr:DUF4013 domain-containing protein [archaeon]
MKKKELPIEEANMKKKKPISKKTKVPETLNFSQAFKYPFNRAKGMLNILWILLPIFGWFALGGYGVRIIQEFTKGQFQKLPTFKFSSDMKLGFFMFIKSIPFIIAYMIVLAPLYLMSPWISTPIRIFVEMFMLPILTINFLNKETVSSFFEFGMVKYVFNNLGDYIIAMLKSIGLAIIYFFMIIILVGIPAMAFTQNIFLADFYRRNVIVSKDKK